MAAVPKLPLVVPPDVQYARSGDVSIAYQAIGEGPLDLVFVPFFGNIRWAWEQPLFARFFRRLALFSRLILLDKRGTGLSDRPRVLTLEAQMDDIRAVLDAVGSERAALLGAVQGSQLCALFAATYPERTSGLVLFNPHASPTDVPPAPRSGDEARERWGTRELSEEFARAVYPSLASDPGFLRWHADYLRFAASPGAAAEFFRMLRDTDVSDVLTTIRLPTLVIYRQERRDAALRVAELIPGARAVQIPGDGGAWVGDEVPAEVEAFLSGQEEALVPDSVLTTILFTDIVGSTERATQVGDRGWRDLLTRHHAAVRRDLARFRGQELDTAGDGFFAAFDGPARAIRCAQAIIADVAELGLDLRAGLHTGECELHDGKLAGIAVNIGARVADEAQAGQVVVSGTVRDLVAGSGIEFEDLGATALKGVPGEWRLFGVRD